MSFKLFLVVLLSVALNQADAQDNRICDCNSEQDLKDNENLWALLKKLEKMAEGAPEEEKIDYAVSPGVLDQFECNCDEKSRKRREVAEIEHPEEVPKDNKEDLDDVRDKREVVKGKAFEPDLRCPKGARWIAEAHTCVPRFGFDEAESAEMW